MPANIDALTCQALFQRPSRHGPAISTPATFAEALASVAPPDPLLVAPAPTTALQAQGGRGDQAHGLPSPYWGTDAALVARGGGSYRRPPGERSAVAAIVSVVIVLVLAVAGVAGWLITHRAHSAGAAPSARPPSSSAPPSAAASVVLKPHGANSFDVYGHDGGNEDASAAPYAIDNNPATFWHSDYYIGYPNLGNLKPGTGLILDMGEQVRLSQVVVQFGTSCCAHVQIEIGNDADPVPSALSAFTVVQSSTTAAGTTVFNVTSNATGRYVLIWFTRLPPLAGTSDEYEAQVYNVVIHGSAVSQSG